MLRTPGRVAPHLAAALVALGLAGALAPPADAAEAPQLDRRKLDYKKDVPRLEAEARRGDADAAETLGEIYHEGLGVARNPERGCDLFEQAATKSLPEA